MTPSEIKSMRNRLFLSQGGLAKKLRVRHQTVSLWERGEKTPNDGNNKKLCMLSKQLSRVRAAQNQSLCDGKKE